MSNRYGRNQKRKHLTEIARLNALLEAGGRAYCKQGEELQDLRNDVDAWAHDICALMGEDSAFNLQVGRSIVSPEMLSQAYMDLMPHDRIMPVADIETIPYGVSHRQIIQGAIWRLETADDKLSRKIRLELYNKVGNPVGYVLPVAHHWTSKDAEYLSRMIADTMIGRLNR